MNKYDKNDLMMCAEMKFKKYISIISISVHVALSEEMDILIYLYNVLNIIFCFHDMRRCEI